MKGKDALIILMPSAPVFINCREMVHVCQWSFTGGDFENVRIVQLVIYCSAALVNDIFLKVMMR